MIFLLQLLRNTFRHRSRLIFVPGANSSRKEEWILEMRFLGRYLVQAAILTVWAVIVIFLFKFIEARKVAAAIAGLGFVVLPSIFLFLELLKMQVQKLHVASLIIFLVLSAFPIFSLRLYYWSEDFSSLSVFGVSTTVMHNLSNKLYVLLLGSAIYHAYKNKKADV